MIFKPYAKPYISQIKVSECNLLSCNLMLCDSSTDQTDLRIPAWQLLLYLLSVLFKVNLQVFVFDQLYSLKSGQLITQFDCWNFLSFLPNWNTRLSPNQFLAIRLLTLFVLESALSSVHDGIAPHILEWNLHNFLINDGFLLSDSTQLIYYLLVLT